MWFTVLNLVWAVLENDLVLSEGVRFLPSCFFKNNLLTIWSTSKYIRWSFHIDMCINESPYPQIDRWSISLLLQLTCIHVFGFVAPLSPPATENLSKCKMDTKDVSYLERKLLFSEARFVGFIFKLCCIHTWFLVATHTNGYACHIELPYRVCIVYSTNTTVLLT